MTDEAQIWLFQAIVAGAPEAIIAATPEGVIRTATRPVRLRLGC